jgi:hypothetical protein
MSYHGCPIEPSDWSDGPDDYGLECRACEGTGEISNDDGSEDTCPSCQGSGFVDDDFNYSDDMR